MTVVAVFPAHSEDLDFGFIEELEILPLAPFEIQISIANSNSNSNSDVDANSNCKLHFSAFRRGVWASQKILLFRLLSSFDLRRRMRRGILYRLLQGRA